MNRDAFLTNSFICTAPETGPGVEFWIDWVPAIDGVPGRALQGELSDGQLWVAPIDNSDLASSAGRLIAPLNDEVLAVLNEDLDSGVFILLCGPSGVISRTHVRLTSGGAAR